MARGMGDDMWRVLLGEGLLATLLSFSELTRLGRLNKPEGGAREGAHAADG